MKIKKKPLVSVIVINYNNSKYIFKSLNSIINQDYQNLEIVFVDDQSTDNSLNIISSFKQKVSLVKLDHNLGFAGGYNEGLKQLDHKFFVIVNFQSLN